MRVILRGFHCIFSVAGGECHLHLHVLWQRQMLRVGKHFFRTRRVMNYGRRPFSMRSVRLCRCFPALASLSPNDSRPPICRHHFTPEMRLANALSYRARGVSDRERTRPEMTLSKVSSQRYFYKKTMCSFVLMCRRLSYDQ